MPLYEYACEECERRFEELSLSPSETIAPPCPQCGGGPTRRLLSVIAGVVGGSGEAPSPACGQGACPACSE